MPAAMYIDIMGKISIRLTVTEMILALVAFVSHIGGIAIGSQTGSLKNWSLWEIYLSAAVLMLIAGTIVISAIQLNNTRKDRTMALTGFVVMTASISAVLCIAGLCAQTELPAIVETARVITLIATAISVGVAVFYPILTSISLHEELEED